jgi:hypothetical protein
LVVLSLLGFTWQGSIKGFTLWHLNTLGMMRGTLRFGLHQSSWFAGMVRVRLISIRLWSR